MIPVKVKVYEWIKQTVGKLTKKGYNSGEEYRFLRKAEKLYADALKNSVGGYSLSEYSDKVKEKIKTENKEKSGEQIDGRKAEARYSTNNETTNASRSESRESNSAYDQRRIKELREAIGQSETKQITKFAKEIVERSKLESYDEEFLIKEAKKVGYDVNFIIKNDNIVSDFIVKGNQLFLPHDVSLNRSGEILDILKPYRNINGEIKTAHISNNRWNIRMISINVFEI